MGNGSSAFAGVPCLTSLCRTLLHISEHHQMLALSLSVASHRPRQKGRRAGIMPYSIPGVERLSAHTQRATNDRWKQEWSRLFHCVNRKQDGVSSTLAWMSK